MKAKILSIFFLLLTALTNGEVFSPAKNVQFIVPDTIMIKLLSTELVRENTSYAVSKRYLISYDKKEILMQVRLLFSDESVVLLKKLIENKCVQVKSIGNIELIDMRRQYTVLSAGNTRIVKYLYDVGNQWSTDALCYSIQLTGFYKRINLYISNIYSTYISEGGYISPWNTSTVDSYKNQANSGIVLYRILDKMLTSINMEDEVVCYEGRVTDNNVRIRESPDVSSSIMQVLEKDSVLSILDCSDERIKIDGVDYPWLKVTTEAGKIGWICSKYVSIQFP